MFSANSREVRRKLCMTTEGSKSLLQAVKDSQLTTVESLHQKSEFFTDVYRTSLNSSIYKPNVSNVIVKELASCTVENNVQANVSSNALDYCKKRKIDVTNFLAPVKKLYNMDTVLSTVKDSAQVNFVDDDESLYISKLFEADESTISDKSIKQNKKKKGKDKGNGEKKRLPNYFLAIRIYNQEIRGKLSALQETIKSINADFVHSFVNVSTLHVTLNVLSLNDLFEIENAINALHLAIQKVSEIVKEYTERTLEFEGLGDFRGQVVFVKLKHNNTVRFIEKLVDVFKNSFKELNVHYSANEKFTPHLTVMKLSKCFKLMKKKGIKRIPQKMYKASKDSHFGFDEVKDVLLCSMADKKDSDGFYKVVASVNLDTMRVVKHDSNEDLDVVSLSTWNVVEKDISVSEDIEASWHIIDEDEIKEAKNAVDNKTFNFSNVNDVEKKNDK